jgi:DNA-binding transcriptional ArsR family regulator
VRKEYEYLSEQFKSLSHPDRIAIIKLMLDFGCERITVKNIYENLKMEQPIVSRHLSIMRKSGLLKREQEGNNTYYYPNKENESASSLMKVFEKLF